MEVYTECIVCRNIDKSSKDCRKCDLYKNESSRLNRTGELDKVIIVTMDGKYVLA